ncbi:alpha/beta fold hydrolase [Ruegeria pomeroyi]|nr:alpha/beta hydrolase [Ruegeria pomeroyi]NVK95744.1 alpha/beta hydrolase [Ruegeria pomeroyi]HCE70832.1 alpha/beta hydrolase [Ruegeria sp.]
MIQMQQDVRQYGDMPSRVVVLHGGPGGAGEVEPLARELGNRGHAVLEPFQTCQTVGGQVDELSSHIERFCAPPVTVIGWSWGAWLGCLLAAQRGMLVRRLILVGSGPFEESYASAIRTTKNSRLTKDQRKEISQLRPTEGDPAEVARFIALSDIADTYARDTSQQPFVAFDGAIHAAVWAEAVDMRRNGALLEAVCAIRCPVVAIHGDYDPRPSEGVQIPLRAALPSADFVQLERCGHKPWQETFAKADFYRALEAAIV